MAWWLLLINMLLWLLLLWVLPRGTTLMLLSRRTSLLGGRAMLCLVSVWYLLVHIVLLWLLHNMLGRDIPGSSVHHARVAWLHTHVERGGPTRVDDASRWGGLAC